MRAGVDEAGRGPLAGPVMAAAVILDPARPIAGLADSKKLSEKKREYLFELIQERALVYAISEASAKEIDELNIFQATLLAMHRAVTALPIQPQHVQVDGKFCPQWQYSSEAIIQGDQRIPAISAASILAKVTRDRRMLMLDQEYPGYGLAQHKGYGTSLHLEALQRLGASAIHRLSFAPCRGLVARMLSS